MTSTSRRRRSDFGEWKYCSQFDTDAGCYSIPSFDHWLPILYVIGASQEGDQLRFIYEGIEQGSISMCSFCFE